MNGSRWAGWLCGAVGMAGWVALAAQSAAPAGPAAAAAPSQSTAAGQPVPTFRTNANLVLLDVVVRNHGEPVEGLKESDFHILENGKLQKVTVFEEHKATEAIRASTPPALPPHVYSDAPQYSVTSAANVLLLDSINTPLSDQVYIRQRMIKDLAKIPDGTEIALFKLDAKLHAVSGFTTDKSAIAKLLEKGPANPETSPMMDPQFTQALQQLSTLGAAAGATPLAEQDMQATAQQNANFQLGLGAEFTMDAFTQLARYLSTIPGRKNVIWYTATMPFSFPTGSAVTASGSGGAVDVADFSGQMQRMLELLAVARVALYPVDSRGLATNPHDWDRLNMEQIAMVTGGKAYYTNAVGAALPMAIANGSNYYTLAYSPIDKNYNGALRKVEVKLQGDPHYDLEYRRGFYANDPATQGKLMPGRTSPMIGAMQHGSLELSQVNFDVRLLPASDPEVKGEPVTPGPAGLVTKGLKHPQRYMVDYWVDPKSVEDKALPGGGQQREIEVTQVGYDSEGIRENYTDTPFEVTMTVAEAQSALQAGIPLHLQIDLPEGKGSLRVGVHDLVSGRIGTVEIPVVVGK